MNIVNIGPARTWDTDDRLLQSLYGLSLWEWEASRPKFGAGITLPLRDLSTESLLRLAGDPEGVITGEEEAQVQEMPPTYRRLAWHFGHMVWALENVKSIIRKSKGTIEATDIDKRFFNAAELSAIREFIARRVRPLSRAAFALAQPLYIQSVPPRTLEFEITASKFLSLGGERVLSVLPKTFESGRFYGLAEPEIQLLAPQVMWVVYYRCVHQTIRTPEQLVDAAREWSPFVDLLVRRPMHERLQKRYSYLLTTESNQVLLAERAS